MKLMKVSKDSIVKNVGAAIATELAKDGEPIMLTAIGNSAVLIAIKSIAAANYYADNDNHRLNCIPRFTSTEIWNGGKRVTAMEFVMERVV